MGQREMLGPALIGANVRLSAPGPECIDDWMRWLRDPSVTRWMSVRFPPTHKLEEEWLDQNARSEHDIIWAVYVGERHIGSTGLHRIDWIDRTALSGTFIGEVDTWAHGYGSEIAGIRSRYAFEGLNLETVTTMVAVPNVASIRMLLKNGYREVGTLHRHWFRGGQYIDVWIGELLRDEWLARGNGV